MAKRAIYLDNAATTRCDADIAAVVHRMLTENYGNPSSLHTMGFAAEKAMSAASAQLAAALRCQPEEILFTSGATEANNLALIGATAARRRRLNGIVVSPLEHASVIETAKWLGENGFETRLVPDGRTDPEAYAALVDEKTALVSCMLVNNETGAINDVAAIAEAVKRKNPQTLVHCDSVQAFGKLPIDLRRLPVDLLSVSAHKIYGPKGVGALFIRKGVRILPLLHGGSQGRGLRPGTENTALIAGFGLAAEMAVERLESRRAHAAMLNERLRCGLNEIDGVVFNSPENSIPFILNVSFPGLRSETLLHFLEARGIYVSSGSACTGGAKSHVLAGLGLSSDRIDSALRLSFSHDVQPEDIDETIAALREASATLARVRQTSNRKERNS